MLIILKIKERWLSGQRHLTVNQTTFVYVGSNPTLSKIVKKARVAELVDAQGLGSCLFKGGGSSPPSGILSTY